MAQYFGLVITIQLIPVTTKTLSLKLTIFVLYKIRQIKALSKTHKK